MAMASTQLGQPTRGWRKVVASQLRSAFPLTSRKRKPDNDAMQRKKMRQLKQDEAEAEKAFTEACQNENSTLAQSLSAMSRLHRAERAYDRAERAYDRAYDRAERAYDRACDQEKMEKMKVALRGVRNDLSGIKNDRSGIKNYLLPDEVFVGQTKAVRIFTTATKKDAKKIEIIEDIKDLPATLLVHVKSGRKGYTLGLTADLRALLQTVKTFSTTRSQARVLVVTGSTGSGKTTALELSALLISKSTGKAVLCADCETKEISISVLKEGALERTSIIPGDRTFEQHVSDCLRLLDELNGGYLVLNDVYAAFDLRANELVEKALRKKMKVIVTASGALAESKTLPAPAFTLTNALLPELYAWIGRVPTLDKVINRWKGNHEVMQILRKAEARNEDAAESPPSHLDHDSVLVLQQLYFLVGGNLAYLLTGLESLFELPVDLDVRAYANHFLQAIVIGKATALCQMVRHRILCACKVDGEIVWRAVSKMVLLEIMHCMEEKDIWELLRIADKDSSILGKGFERMHILRMRSKLPLKRAIAMSTIGPVPKSVDWKDSVLSECTVTHPAHQTKKALSAIFKNATVERTRTIDNKFSELSKDKPLKSGDLLVPSSSQHPTTDAYLVVEHKKKLAVVCFQFTLSSRHSFCVKGMSDFNKAMMAANGAELKIFFVVVYPQQRKFRWPLTRTSGENDDQQLVVPANVAFFDVESSVKSTFFD